VQVVSFGNSILIAAGLCAFFLIPLLLENKYLHYNLNPFASTWSGAFVDANKLLKPMWTFIDAKGKLEYQTWQLGINHILILLAAVVLPFVSNKFRSLLLYMVGVLGLSLFLMHQSSTFIYLAIPLLQHIQFPWRFAALSSVALSFIAAIVSEYVVEKSVFIRKFFASLIIAGFLILYLPYAKGHGYSQYSDRFYFYELVKNTESAATTPLWSAESEKYPRAPFLPTVLPETAHLNYLYKNSFNHEYTITTSEKTRVIDHTFYFPNWQVLVNNKNVPIEFQNPEYRGLITFDLPPGINKIRVLFEDTKLRKVA
jgi:hypothetical protein